MGKKKIKINYETTEQSEMKSLLIIIAVVILLVGAAYVITRVFVTKDLFNEEKETEETTKVEIDYNTIIVGEILNRQFKTYYVMVYDSTGDDAYDMNSLFTSYQGLAKHNQIYKVDLNNKLNSAYYDATNTNLKAKKVEDFKFGDITLLKIVDGKVSSAFTTIKAMKKELNVK